ncbi:MAG: bifunctional phosphoribosylaminoimidazolecarboxamide formyltransferase/IMP cyclohydrolase PurH, partial [Thermovirga sp.]|nr:bifunctional phosphoribosylaminoimidazolecarboxamide formyltransferase/IMP cyclohydrolase PurH [Thermovirga sp.]
MGQKRALISVFDKKNVDGLAKDLADLGWEIVSSSGTARHIREAGVPVKEVEDLTGYPHMLGGRVKTLHPSVFGGILARRHFEGDKADVEKFGIPMIDMVVCNLYPFQETLKKGTSLEELLENIDIGGVTLIRAAAKNFRHVVPVTDPEDYPTVAG